MESLKEEERRAICEGVRRSLCAAGLTMRFGFIYCMGLFVGVSLVLEDVFTLTRTPLQAELFARRSASSMTSFCVVSNNLLGSLFGGGKKLPPVSVETDWFVKFGLTFFFLGLGLHLMHTYLHPLRSLIWRSRRRVPAFTRRLLAWVCSLSALIVLINNTSFCFGLVAFSSLTICAVGLFNLVADPDDGIAMSMWVIEQSVVVAFLVAAVGEGGASAFLICTALLPIAAALVAIVFQKITVLVARKELQLPAEIVDFFYNKELSQYYTPKSEHDKSWAIDVEYRLEDPNNSSSSLYLPLL